jgi:hypothetical protein
MNRKIRIATEGVPHDYRASLVPCALESLGYHIEWCDSSNADLLVRGPFYRPSRHLQRWIPKLLRHSIASLLPEKQRASRPAILFQTAENLRHDHTPCDYSISFDLCVNSSKHIRLPYWMEMINWRHEGVYGNANSRFGKLLEIERLMQPLGDAFLKRQQKAAFFSSHLREPRATLIGAVSAIVPVDGYGPHFDAKITHHSNSGLGKFDVLQNYSFNLCPENSMYPGYYTEKIPEAFAAGCVPLAWADTNVCIDFNPSAIINLGSMMHNGFDDLAATIRSPASLRKLSDCALLKNRPSLEGLKAFLRTVAHDVTT